MANKVSYTQSSESRVICPPTEGFPLERLNDYVERCLAKQSFTPDELADFVKLLCDDELIASLTPDKRRLVQLEIKPTVNAILQRKAKKIKAARKVPNHLS
ncbi:hypothetical protein HZC53_06210 [Candidatus Uhrbacteria bacterium]|nr:hypothetical protein [Candidatus Uhrbacteria bacterium]